MAKRTIRLEISRDPEDTEHDPVAWKCELFEYGRKISIWRDTKLEAFERAIYLYKAGPWALDEEGNWSQSETYR